MKILVVGAGFSGAVYARSLAEMGHFVCVIDQRNHIAGNAYDAIHNGSVRVHEYGPHLFHTNNYTVVKWLKQFGDFIDYEHKVTALFGKKFLPLPVSRATFETYYDCVFPTDQSLMEFIDGIALKCDAPRNAAEFLNSRVGVEITDLLFRPYTKKMWGQDLEDIDASVVSRVSINMNREYRYFPSDKYQILPVDGYASLFEKILGHKNIEVNLSTKYDKALSADFDQTFSSAAIDEHYDYCFGPLPYRSLRFHHVTCTGSERPPTATVNYTDENAYTRETHWDMLPCHKVSSTKDTIKTIEEPCDFIENNMERYYPIKDAAGENAALYQKYKSLADKTSGIKFIGRCGTYQYLDMHQVINQSLMGVMSWATERAA